MIPIPCLLALKLVGAMVVGVMIAAAALIICAVVWVHRIWGDA